MMGREMARRAMMMRFVRAKRPVLELKCWFIATFIAKLKQLKRSAQKIHGDYCGLRLIFVSWECEVALKKRSIRY